MLSAELDPDHSLADQFRAFIEGSSFPCVGAKSALSRGQLTVVVARDIRSAWHDLKIYPALCDFARAYRPEKRLFQSFAVLFEQPRTLTEREFESAMWDRLQSLTDKDEWHGQRHDPCVSADPENPHFSLSFGGEGFFCVGLHPHASRPGRRFMVPAIVFNLHDQFEELRKSDLYNKLHEKIMDRDMSLAGSVNPMLKQHGEGSEAPQYSGRQVGDSWKCPFQRSARDR